MSTPALYHETVLDHYRNPRHRGALDASTHAADGVNPLCGDALRMELRCVDGCIVEFAFSGEACAITTAAASMLGDLAAGLARADVDALRVPFERLIAGEPGDYSALGALIAFAELKRYPARRKCALLPLATLRAALAGDERVSTESP